jgi:hypothetical protein
VQRRLDDIRGRVGAICPAVSGGSEPPASAAAKMSRAPVTRAASTPKYTGA